MAIDSEYKIAVLTGKPGEDGNNLKSQYSSDNKNWHDTFTTGDLYMRTSPDNGTSWSAGMRIVGEKGATGAKGDTGPQGPQGVPGDTGATGQRGGRDLSITTAPSSYTTKVGNFTPTYRIALSTVKTQSGIDTVYVGDTLVYSVYRYPIGYTDASYVYTAARTSVKGDKGDPGDKGDKGPQGERGFSSRTIAYRVNYSSFSSANNGEIYVCGYNSEGKQADTVGYVIVNGTTHYVKGALNQDCCTDGYVIAEIGGTTEAPKAPKYCVRTWDGKWMMGAGSAAAGWTDITSTIAKYIVLGQMRSYATEGAITFEEQTPVLLSSINFKAWDYNYSGIVGSTTDYTSATITPFILTQKDDGTFVKSNGTTKSARRGNFVICLNATTPTATTAVPVIKVWNGTWWETIPDTNSIYRNCQVMAAGDLPALAGYYDTLKLDVPTICGSYIKTLTANKAFINEFFSNDIVVGNKIRSDNNNFSIDKDGKAILKNVEINTGSESDTGIAISGGGWTGVDSTQGLGILKNGDLYANGGNFRGDLSNTFFDIKNNHSEDILIKSISTVSDFKTEMLSPIWTYFIKSYQMSLKSRAVIYPGTSITVITTGVFGSYITSKINETKFTTYTLEVPVGEKTQLNIIINDIVIAQGTLKDISSVESEKIDDLLLTLTLSKGVIIENRFIINNKSLMNFHDLPNENTGYKGSLWQKDGILRISEGFSKKEKQPAMFPSYWEKLSITKNSILEEDVYVVFLWFSLNNSGGHFYINDVRVDVESASTFSFTKGVCNVFSGFIAKGSNVNWDGNAANFFQVN